MDYYVIGENGSRRGPADLVMLNVWSIENEITPNSDIQVGENGEIMKASMVEGLHFVEEGASKPRNIFEAEGVTYSRYQRGSFWKKAPTYYMTGAQHLKHAWFLGSLGMLFGICMPPLGFFMALAGLATIAQARSKGGVDVTKAKRFNLAALIVATCVGVLGLVLIIFDPAFFDMLF